jgi:hypothetical protein
VASTHRHNLEDATRAVVFLGYLSEKAMGRWPCSEDLTKPCLPMQMTSNQNTSSTFPFTSSNPLSHTHSPSHHLTGATTKTFNTTVSRDTLVRIEHIAKSDSEPAEPLQRRPPPEQTLLPHSFHPPASTATRHCPPPTQTLLTIVINHQ